MFGFEAKKEKKNGTLTLTSAKRTRLQTEVYRLPESQGIEKGNLEHVQEERDIDDQSGKKKT